MSSRRSRNGGSSATSNAEPVEQIRPEPARRRQRRQIGIGRGDDPHIDGQGFVASNPLERAVLDRTQDFLLHGKRGRGDLVKEQGAAVRRLEPSGAAANSAGESTGLMPEQLGIQQRLRQRRAVELDEGAIPAGREIGKTVGNQLLAGAALADDQDRAIERGKARHMSQHLEEDGALADRDRRRGGNGHVYLVRLTI